MALIVAIAALTLAANLVTATDSSVAKASGSDGNKPFEKAFSYLVLTRRGDTWHDERLYMLDEWMKDLKIPRNADAETILSRFTESGGKYFTELAKDEANLNCNEIKSHWLTVFQAYSLRRKTSGTIEEFLLSFGARAYGYCARKFNREFSADAKAFPSEQELDQIIAFATEPELKLEQCAALSQEELLKRAKQVKLARHKTKVHRMLEVINKLWDIPSLPTDPREAANTLFNFFMSHCSDLSNSVGNDIGVMSMAYAFRGDSLAEFQPRLLKLHEYRRICNAKFNYPGITKVTFEELFSGKKASPWTHIKTD